MKANQHRDSEGDSRREIALQMVVARQNVEQEMRNAVN